MRLFLFTIGVFFLLCTSSYSQTITTFAGNGIATYSGDGGAATSASLSRPISCVMDNAGNLLISDFANSRIRKVSTSGVITTIAGTGTYGFSGDGGPATAAEISDPEKITVDAAGNIYFCDFYNQRVRKINTAGIITTIAGTGTIGYTGDGGPATAATFWDPAGIAIDAAGNIYITDEWNNRIRKINTSGIITTIAGDGSTGYMAGGYGGDGGLATAAQINFPVGIAVTSSGNIVFSDDGNNRVREISTATGIITTIAGNGTAGSTGDGAAATLAELDAPEGVAVDPAGNVYICETTGNRVRKVNASGTISTLAGTGTAGFSGDGSAATLAELDYPEGIFVDTITNCVYICDADNNRVRSVCETPVTACNTISMPDTLHVCVGDTATIPATISGSDSVLSIVWSPATGLSSTTILDPVVTTGTPGWYYLTVNNLIPDNLVVNGDFSLGNTGFSSSYSYVSGPGSLIPAGVYAITTNPLLDHPDAASFGDHTTGTGNMMAINGASTPIDVWCETIAVTPNTNYAFSAWFANWSSDTSDNLPILQFEINGVLVGSTFSFPHPDGLWTEFYTTWNSGTNTSISICINDQQTAASGNDFAIDDISFNPICTVTDSIYIAATAPDTTYTHTDTSVCASVSTVTLSAVSGYTTYHWSTGATTATINVTTDGTYWVSETGPCIAYVDTFHVTFIPLPLVNLGDDTTICAGNSVTFQSSDGPYTSPTYLWNTGSITPAITTSVAGTFWLDVTVDGCTGSDTVNLTVNPTPPQPTVASNAPTCSGKSLAFTVTGEAAGTTYSWSGPNGFSSILQNPVINPVDTEATGIYSLAVTFNGCSAPLFTLAALVDSTPAGMVVSSNSPICQYNTLLFTAYTPTPGVLYTWSGPLSFSTTIENPVIGDANTDAGGQYRVIASRGFCYDTSFLDVIIDSIPLNINIGGSTPVCSQSTLTLYSTFTPSGGTYSWTGPDGYSTVSISSNQNIYNATTLASGIYTVTETLSGCTSAIAVTPYLTVDSTPQVPNISSNSPVCEGSTLNLYSSDSTQAVSYSWMGPNGFSSSIQNPSIYTVTPAAAGDYTVTATLGICSTPAQTTVAITLTPSFTPTSNSPVCSGDTLFLYANNVAGSTVSWSGPYTFTSLAPDPLRPSAVTEDGGIYEVQALLNGCYSTAYDTVVINQTPGPPFVSWLTYCQYYPAPPLMANDTNVLWYNTDMATGGSPIPPVPSTANIGTTFYYATQTVSGCISAIDSIQVTVNPTPTVTVTPADTAVCPHSSYQLTATSTAALATYQWYPSIYLDNTNTATVTTSPETNITYTVVSGNQYGCTDTVTSSVTVYPAAVIYLGDSVTLYPGETYTMSPQTNCTQFSWFPPAGLSNNTIPNPVASPAVSTKYTLYGQTENGCIASDSIEIYESSQSQVALPNAFTPGSGANNEFKIIRKGIVSLNYFRIFDRWGQKVFETTNIDMGWDGSFNGTPQPFGVYVYEIEAVSSTDQNILLHGNVTLLR